VEVTELGTEAGASSGKSVSKHYQFVVQLKVYDYMKSADIPPHPTDLTSKNCMYDILVPNTQTFELLLCSNILRNTTNFEGTHKSVPIIADTLHTFFFVRDNCIFVHCSQQ
jgi:hypothetical protein